ncbi:MAG: HAD hydrolase-like protein, partial [Clostridiales bacterium]|nr:HAD hydrolase-like protein [Candidatus Crickella caballi]
MKYKCLVFDHDDTTVNSTATIHYPCFVEFVKKYDLGIDYSLEDYVRYNFEPGVFTFYSEICGMSEETMELEYQYWIKYASQHRAKAFPGIKEIMKKHRAEGGLLAVVSHSRAENIRMDYEYNSLPMPDEIFGFEQPRDELKPSPVPLLRIMEKYSLKPGELLVIDDLKPGYTMARAAGVDFAAANWCFDIPANTEFMRENADYLCNTIEE